jgi:signal peptidase I
MKLVSFIFSGLKILIVFSILPLVVFALSSRFNTLGNYKPFLVQSGSMEPAIMTGDIVVIQGANTYEINDVVTFNGDNNKIITHRIVDVIQGAAEQYATKGDANRAEDSAIISDKQILGKVFLVLPKLGYFVAFAQSQRGLIFLLIIPAVVLILDEVLKIIKNVKNRD